MDDLDRQRGHVEGEDLRTWVARELQWFATHPIECVGCGRTTTDPDRWDPEFLTGAVYCEWCQIERQARA